MKQVLTILETAVILGITTTTLRRWDKLNKFKPEYRTIGGHRRYLLQNILKLINPNIDDKTDKITLCYSRVSSYDQKEDLKRQSQILLNYCEDKQFNNIELIEDLGSGLNFKKKGLKKLIKLIINSQRQVITIW